MPKRSLVNDKYIEGQQLAISAGNAAEREKVGTLRAGTTGMVEDNGTVVGVCAARAYLRHIGVDVDGGADGEADGSRLSRELMFEAGRTNEDIWAANLTRAGLKLKREEDIPTSWFADNKAGNVAVTGRPDIVVVDDAGNPTRGIELKLLSSLWKVKSTRFGGKPGMQHLLQAGHYAWQLGVPFELWYTNRAQFPVTGDWVQKMFPQYGEEGSEDCSYSFFRYELSGSKLTKKKIGEEEYDSNSKVKLQGLFGWSGKERLIQVSEYVAEVKAVLPCRVGFLLEWNEAGKLTYAPILTSGEVGKAVETIITVEKIARFYSFVAEMADLGVVPAPPLNLEADGSKANFKLEDYCSLAKSGLCCKQKKGAKLDVWEREVTEKCQRTQQQT